MNTIAIFLQRIYKLTVKASLILLLLFVVAVKNAAPVSAQKIDSLLAELPKQKEDTNKVILYGEIIKEYINQDIEKMVPYIQEMLKLSKKIHYFKGEAKAYIRYADYYRRTRRWEEALPYLNKADSVYTFTGDKEGKSFVDNFMGVFYTETGHFEKALTMHHKALDYYTSTNNTVLEGATIAAIAKLFYYMQRYDESEKYYMRSMEIYRKLGNKKEVSIALLNIGSIYTLKGEYKKAEHYFDLCLELQKELKQTGVIAKIQWNMGWIYAERGQFSKSKQVLNECYENYSSLQDTLMMALVKMYMGHTYNKMQEYDKALELLDEGKAMAHIGEADSIVMGDFYKEYHSVYKNKGDYAKALEYYEKYVENKNEVFSGQTADKISELKEKYETEKKEQENLALKDAQKIRALRFQRQWYLIYGLAGFMVLITFAFILLARNNRIRTRQKTMQLEQKMLRSQMNPHFIFNALISIRSFMQKTDPKQSGKFLTSFARLMRGALENSREESISLSKEISWLENYISLQKLRYENAFEYIINADPGMNTENIFIPPMLSLPFIENTIEQRLAGMQGNGKLEIRFTEENNQVLMSVKDNGRIDPGVDAGLANVTEAIKITNDRLQLLNKRKSRKVRFHIVPVREQGTILSFYIPYHNKL